MSSIDSAANAFSKDMGGKISTETTPALISMDEVFTPRQIEQDVQAGGDEVLTEDELAQQEVEEKPRRDKKSKIEDNEDDDPLYADDDAAEGEEEGDDADDADEKEGDDGEPDPDAEEFPIDDYRDQKVTLVVDGQEKEVTLGEALDGYIRTDTFHQRMNEVDEAKTLIRTEAQKVIESRKEAIGLLDQLEADLKELTPVEPDWDKAFADNPEKARLLQKQFVALKERIDNVRNARSEQQNKLKGEQTEYIKNFAVTEKNKFESLPENKHWRSDPKKQQKDLAAMVRTAKSAGLTDDEIRGTLDSRLLTILLRASKYDRMVATRPKTRLANKGKISAKPGAVNVGATRRSAQKGLGRAQQQLAKDGSVRSAASVFQHLL